MSFTSLFYLVLLVITVLVSLSIRGRAIRWWLLFVSLVFFAVASPADTAVAIGVLGVTYLLGLALAKYRSPAVLWSAIALVLAPLVLTKYSTFIASNVRAIFGGASAPQQLPLLPIGISFYTFICLGYLIDIYRRDVEPERSLSRFFLFVGFFPQVVAGPIERYNHLSPQIRRLEQEGAAPGARISYGFAMVVMGLFLKSVVADNLATFVNDFYANPVNYTNLDAVRAAYYYSLEIYCDVYGYTLIALGSAHMLGLSLINNFNHPYFATDIQEFWKRWHISLTTWFRDYLYFPMAVTRTMRGRWITTVMITFLLTGLWHGANWTFVVWGGLNGLALVLHRLYKRYLPAAVWPVRMPQRLARLIGMVVTFHFVTMCWIFFRARDLQTAGIVFRMTGRAVAAGTITRSASTYQPFFAIIFALGVGALIIQHVSDLAGRFERAAVWQQAAIVAATAPLFFLSSPDAIQFIYFQF